MTPCQLFIKHWRIDDQSKSRILLSIKYNGKSIVMSGSCHTTVTFMLKQVYPCSIEAFCIHLYEKYKAKICDSMNHITTMQVIWKAVMEILRYLHVYQ